MTTHPTKLDLETYVAGGCSDFDRTRIRQHLNECFSCRGLVNALEEERLSFLQAMPFEKTITELPRIRRQTPQRRAIYSLAACLTLLLGLGAFFAANRPDTFRSKGGVAIGIFVKTRDGRILSRKDNVYRPGEQIQFVYSCGAESHFALMSLDERGSLTLFHPQGADSLTTLEKGRDLPLPSSIVLDDYLGREMYVAVFSRLPRPLQDVKSAIVKGLGDTASWKAPPVALEGMVVRTVVITKVQDREEIGRASCRERV